MPATPETSHKPATTSTVLAVIAALVVVLMIALGIGCARPASSDWAQTSPVMNADKTTSAVNLGVRD